LDCRVSNDWRIRKDMEGSSHWLISLSISGFAGGTDIWTRDLPSAAIPEDHDIIKLQLSHNSALLDLNCLVREKDSVYTDAIVISYKLHFLLPFTKKLKS
jgi:hypothetical protein